MAVRFVSEDLAIPHHKEIAVSLTQDRLKELLSYDPVTGVFRWAKPTNSRTNVWDIAGGVKPKYKHKHKNRTQYLVITISRKLYFAHRLVWLYMYGKWPQHQIDHIDGDSLNNCIANLRDVTRTENQKNRRLAKNNTSGVTGVVWNSTRNRWHAKMKVEGKYIHLGSFADICSAVKARLAGEKRYGYHENHGTIREIDRSIVEE